MSLVSVPQYIPDYPVNTKIVGNTVLPDTAIYIAQDDATNSAAVWTAVTDARNAYFSRWDHKLSRYVQNLITL